MLVRTPSGTEGIADVEVSTNTGFEQEAKPSPIGWMGQD